MRVTFSAAERAVSAIDTFLNRAVLAAWTSTLRHHLDPEDLAGGDICSLPQETLSDDDQPLD
jgi:hypothetical protein